MATERLYNRHEQGSVSGGVAATAVLVNAHDSEAATTAQAAIQTLRQAIEAGKIYVGTADPTDDDVGSIEGLLYVQIDNSDEVQNLWRRGSSTWAEYTFPSAGSGQTSAQVRTSITNALNALIGDDVRALTASDVAWSGSRSNPFDFRAVVLNPGNVVANTALTSDEVAKLTGGEEFEFIVAVTNTIANSSGATPIVQLRLIQTLSAGDPVVTTVNIPENISGYNAVVKLNALATHVQAAARVTINGSAGTGTLAGVSATLTGVGSHQDEFEELIERLVEHDLMAEQNLRKQGDDNLLNALDRLRTELSQLIANAGQTTPAVRALHQSLGLGFLDESSDTPWAGGTNLPLQSAAAWHTGNLQNQIPGSFVDLSSATSADPLRGIYGGELYVRGAPRSDFRPFIVGFYVSPNPELGNRPTEERDLIKIRIPGGDYAPLLNFMPALGPFVSQQRSAGSSETVTQETTVYQANGNPNHQFNGIAISSVTLPISQDAVYTVHCRLSANGVRMGPDQTFTIDLSTRTDVTPDRQGTSPNLRFHFGNFDKTYTLAWRYDDALDHLIISNVASQFAAIGDKAVDSMIVWVTLDKQVTVYHNATYTRRIFHTLFDSGTFGLFREWYVMALFYQGANGNLFVRSRIRDDAGLEGTLDQDLGYTPGRYDYGDLVLNSGVGSIRRLDYGEYLSSTPLGSLPTQADAVQTFTGGATRIGTASQFGVSEGTPSGLASDGTNLFMVGATGDALYILNVLDGTARKVGSATAFGASVPTPNGLTYDPADGLLYMVDSSSDRFFSVDPNTGIATRIGTAVQFGVSETGPSGLTVHNGVMYFVGTGNAALFTLDKTTGIATRVGTATEFGVAEAAPSGLFSHGGVLYLIGTTNDALFSLDPATGIATRVGTATRFGVNATSPSGITSHRGEVYWVGQSQDALYKLDVRHNNSLAAHILYGRHESDWLWGLITAGGRTINQRDYIEFREPIEFSRGLIGGNMLVASTDDTVAWVAEKDEIELTPQGIIDDYGVVVWFQFRPSVLTAAQNDLGTNFATTALSIALGSGATARGVRIRDARQASGVRAARLGDLQRNRFYAVTRAGASNLHMVALQPDVTASRFKYHDANRTYVSGDIVIIDDPNFNLSESSRVAGVTYLRSI